MKEFMHVGVPTTVAREGEIYAEGIKTHLITPDTNEFHIEYLRRSYYAKIIPKEKSSEYFGIYDIFGKGASFMGTMLMGISTQIFH